MIHQFVLLLYKCNQFEIILSNNTKNYRVSGTKAVKWSGYQLNRETLTVQFMGLSSDQCSISSRAEIDQTLDEIIDAAKHKNKI